MLLTGRRCTVRRWRMSDAGSLVRHGNNLNIAKQLRDRFPHPYTRQDAQRFLKFAVSAEESSNFAIDVHGQAVGAIGFVRHTDVERFSAEVGYWLGEDYRRRGIATEALVLLTDYVFDRVNLLRLFALPFADNEGSVRVLEKAGYVREATLRASSVKYGKPRDQALYARINPRWRGIDG
jgi:RimJ/RimL family protein N-acetyltransferase